MDEIYSPALVAQVQALIDDDKKPILSRWLEILEIFETNNITQRLQLKATLFLVHPSNRGKLGLNPHNAHRTGKNVIGVGGNADELKNAVGFELAPPGPARKEQTDFNKSLAELSTGLLAEVNGSEKYATIGCGHFTAFMRAAFGGCKTLEPTLQDSFGNIDKGLINRDKQLNKLMHEGWMWTIIPYDAERAWPKLPDLGQRALNATNNVASQASELEIASTIAAFAEEEESSGRLPIDWAACTDRACQGNPPCKKYAALLGTFARMYGGGKGTPIVRQLDSFAKTLNQNLVLGEEYLTAVVEVKISDVKPCPRVRGALVACNLTATKSSDGIAKLLTKSDIQSLKGKDKVQSVFDLESKLEQAESFLTELVANKSLTDTQALDIRGRLQVRSAAHLCGKGKLTFEGVEYKSVDRIVEVFFDEVQKVLPGAKCPAASSATVATTPAPSELLNFQDVSDAKRLATGKGFNVGNLVYDKAIGQSVLFCIKALGDTVSLERRELLPRGPATQTAVDLPAFLKEWSIYKGSPPLLLEEAAVALRTPLTTEAIKLDMTRALMFAALHDYAKLQEKHCCSNMFHVVLHAQAVNNAVYAAKRISKHSLVLVPSVSLQYIGFTKGPSAIPTGHNVTVNGHIFEVYLSKPLQPNYEESSKPAAEWDKNACVHPYFYVSTTTTKGEVTMSKTIVEHKGCRFPVLRNEREVQELEQLCVFDESAQTSKKKKQRVV